MITASVEPIKEYKLFMPHIQVTLSPAARDFIIFISAGGIPSKNSTGKVKEKAAKKRRFSQDL